MTRFMTCNTSFKKLCRTPPKSIYKICLSHFPVPSKLVSKSYIQNQWKKVLKTHKNFFPCFYSVRGVEVKRKGDNLKHFLTPIFLVKPWFCWPQELRRSVRGLGFSTYCPPFCLFLRKSIKIVIFVCYSVLQVKEKRSKGNFVCSPYLDCSWIPQNLPYGQCCNL